MQNTIENIIKQRLNLQTVEKNLDINYGLEKRDFFLNLIKVKNKYNSLDDDKKKYFIKLIGGGVNYLKTREYIENL